MAENSISAYLLTRLKQRGAKKTKGNKMDGRNRSDIEPGLAVKIVLKKDQRSGRLTEGVVKDILTNSSFHPHGIKVRLESGDVGRVKEE